MTGLWPKLLFCSCLLWGAQSESPIEMASPTTTTTTVAPTPPPDMTYWLTFPTVVLPGTNLPVRAYIPTATGPVTLRLDLIDINDMYLQDGQNFSLNATNKVQSVNFQISSGITEHWSRLYLRARTWGGMETDGFQPVFVNTKRLSIFIQTDKPMYKPDQTVKFRALVLQADTKMADKPMDIIITDPKDNMIAKWAGVKGKDSGVFQGDMIISSHPPLGIWNIKGTVEGETHEKQFEIKEYELPRFEVKMDFPSYGLMTDETVEGKITAKYTFGSPVQGNCIVTVKFVSWMPMEDMMPKVFQLDENGVANVIYNYTELSALVSRISSGDSESFQFKAEVIDIAGDAMTASTTVTFYTSPVKFQFTERTPSAFKPGLPFTAFVKASQPDGKPLVNPMPQFVEFSLQYDGASMNKVGIKHWKVKLNKNGTAKGTVNSIPEKASSFTITATAYGETIQKYVTSFESPEGVFLTIRKQYIQNGDQVRIWLSSNKPFGTFNCQVFSKGELVAAKTFARTTLRSTATCAFDVKQAMVPVADVIAFFESENGEVVADNLVLRLKNRISNKVTLEFKEPEVRPGQSASLTLTTSKPKSTLFLLGVDKSVKQLGTGNDITYDEVISELKAYWPKYEYSPVLSYYQEQNSRAYDVFEDAGAGIITDGLVPGKDTAYDVPKSFRTSKYPTLPFPIADALTEPATPAEQLRTNFPETWLWQTVEMGDTLTSSLNVTAPDTITSWEVSAFAVNTEFGLTVAENPATLTTVKKLFVILDLPYSAVRGEDVCFKAVTFNRHDTAVDVSITLAQSSDFKNILVTEDANEPGQFILSKESVTDQRNLGLLQPEASVATTFCVSPQILGEMPVQVTVRSDVSSDGLVRNINIKPEGVELSQNYPVLIEILPKKSFSHTVKFELPDNLVPGSLRQYISVFGDVLGVAANNLEDLLKMPYGCGEQNMVHFAPNTYLIDYLTRTGRLNPTILTKAKNFMLSGYQQQLSYQHSDGSFSAFGESDPSGSTWLTAFVTKCFVQATALGSDIIAIEPNIIIKAVNWLTYQLLPDGTFDEPGYVIQKEMQGGSGKGLGLTASVTITLTEVNKTFQQYMSSDLRELINLVLTLSVDYLENQLPSVTNKTWGKADSYKACILAYALARADSPKADEAINEMNKLAETSGLLKYWSGPIESSQNHDPWRKKTNALSIEMTAYALLATMEQGVSADKAVKVFRWLNQQIGPNGGFTSTQDTVVGLQALAAMSQLALGENFPPFEVSATWNMGEEQTTRSVTINKDNVMLMHTFDIPLLPNRYADEITIHASSSSTEGQRMFALAEVVVHYNMNDQTSSQMFSISTTVKNPTPTSFELNTCVSLRANIKPEDNSMFVVEISVASGHRVISGSDFGKSLKKEFSTGMVVLYYYNLESEECCSLKMAMANGIVANLQPYPVRVYDYYQPQNVYITYYTPPKSSTAQFMN